MLEASVSADQDNLSLPAWIYRDAEFFEREKQAIFRNSWQVVCHLSDIPQPGDFHTFEFLGESVVVMRAEDGGVRAFHNVCRHRAARLLDGAEGSLRQAHHLPVPRLDLRARRTPGRPYPTARASRAWTPRVTVWRRSSTRSSSGFIFVRFAPGLPSVREMAAPVRARARRPTASRSWCRWGA